MSGYSWDFEKPIGDGGEGTDYAKFPEGITRVRFIDDAPYVRWTHWMPKFSRSVTCPGKGCPICAIRKQEKANGIKQQSYNVAKRFSMNILNRETKRLELAEQGKTFFEDLRDLMGDLKKEGKTLLDADIKVRRRGTGKEDTSYRLDIDEKYPLSDEDKKLIEGKIDLAEFYKPHTIEQITELIQVTEDHANAWKRIMGYETESQPTQQADEDIELS